MVLDTTYMKAKLKEKGLKQSDLARESDYMALGHLSAIINGYVRPSTAATKRILGGLRQLGFTEEEIGRISAD